MGLSAGSKGFLAVLAFAVTAVVAGLLFFNANSAAVPNEVDGPVTVVIPEGTGASGIAQLLEEQGVIRSALVFSVRARLDGRASQIQAGTYELDPGLGAGKILDVLAAGPPRPPTFRVTIPEGRTVEQTLADIAGAQGSPFTVDQLREALVGVAVPSWIPVDALPEGAEPFEGLLAPNTYEFRADVAPQDILTRLVQQTETVMESLPPSAGGLDRYQTLVLASLIEREARLAEEQPRISSVIHNRLEVGQALQIDATVEYAQGEPVDSQADYEFDSPWNTYRIQGLPPTPIAGVGESAIRAAAQPADEDFFYYVLENPETGAHRFSRTFEEHQQAIAEIRG